MKKSAKIISLVLAVLLVAGIFAACTNETATTEPATQLGTSETPTAETETKLETIEAGKLTIGTNAEFPPFEFVNNAGGAIDNFDGIDMVMGKQIAEDNGLTAVVNNLEFDSLLIALQNGQLDCVIAGMTATDKRRKSVDFSTTYYTATQVMIVKEGSDIQKAADMQGKNIAVIQGYTGETCVKDMGYEYEAFKKGTEAILELNNGKCDVVVLDSATAQKYVKDNPGLVIVEDADAFEGEEYAIAVKKGNEALLEAINKSVQAMLDNGTISELAVKFTEE